MSNRFSKVMAAFFMFAIISVATLLVAADVSAAETPYQLVWSDEFNGTELNRENWTPMVGGGGWGNNEYQYYRDNEENIKVSNGTLQITARITEDENSESGYIYTSGRLTSTGKQNFKYGKFEARIKIPAVSGLWPAFWAMGDDEPQGWPMCGEIDILETWNTAQLAQGAFHWNKGPQYVWPDTHKYTYKSIYQGGVGFEKFDKTQFHTYGVEWTAEGIKWYIDDIVYFNLNTESDPEKADELAHHYYMLLNMAVGGNLTGGAPVDESQFPATMYVDWVRVYQQKGSGAEYTKTWKEADKATTYTVSIKKLGKIISTTKVYEGDTFVVPAAGTKKGYVFNGYKYNGAEWDSSLRIRKNIVIEADWKKVVVKKAKIKLKAKKKAVLITCSSKKGADGYQVTYGRKKKAKGNKITFKGKKITAVRLKSGKKYYFKARPYKIDSRGKKIWGTWSKIKKVKVK